MFNLTTPQLVVSAVVAVFIVFKLLSSDKVKAFFTAKKTATPSYNYTKLSSAMKDIHDHVSKVGTSEEKDALDNLVRLIMKSGTNETE